jgi:hypothetical protein
MLKSLISNIPSWLLVRLLEVGILYIANVVYLFFSEEVSLRAMYESAYYTAVYAYLGYMYLGYAVFQIVILFVSVSGWTPRLVEAIVSLSPLYVPASIFLSNSLPNSDPSYFIRAPLFLVALLLAILVNRWGYLRFYSRTL